FRAGEHYWNWFESIVANARAGHLGSSFRRGGIDGYWGDNPEHPPVMKVLSGVSWRVFHRCECAGAKRGLRTPGPIPGRHRTIPLLPRRSPAFRFPPILMAGLGAGLVFLFARRLLGALAAGGAAGLLGAQPHYFFHAQIACFDAPITTMAVLVGYA